MIIYINDKSKNKSGAYGEYYKYSPQQGVKVFFETHTEKFDNIRHLIQTNHYKDAFIESIYFNLVHGSGSSRVVICKKTSGYCLGILMPHFSGKHMSSLKKSFLTNKKTITRSKTKIPLIASIHKLLAKSGIFHHDIHENNIITNKGKCQVIDFSPDLIQFYGKKSEFNKEANCVLTEFSTIYKWSFNRDLRLKSMKNQLLKRIGFTS